jgi:hypothetical protein
MPEMRLDTAMKKLLLKALQPRSAGPGVFDLGYEIRLSDLHWRVGLGDRGWAWSFNLVIQLDV